MGKKKLHLICNAHLDPIYMWQLTEGLTEALSTFRTAARFCEEYDGFVFNHNEALLYDTVRVFEPALFEKIRKLVREGKWHIMGGWYLQPDCNMPSGESMIRQIHMGRNFFKKYFGTEPETAINFDSFGHSRGLVQLLKKSGYDSYVFCRPNEKEFPDLKMDDFVWVGYDGSEVAGHRSSEHYSTNIGLAAKEIGEWVPRQDPGRPYLYLWGIGDHGGGPSREDLRLIEELGSSCESFAFEHSTPEAYFADLRAHAAALQLQRVEQPLNHVAQGGYTSLLQVKQGHRALENDLYKAEKMMAHASAAGLLDYPQQELTEAAKDLLLSEFHDIMPGSIIRRAKDDILRTIDHGREIAGRLQLRAFNALTAGQEPMRKNEIPIFVYNPHPFPVRGVFECEYGLPYDPTAGYEALKEFYAKRSAKDKVFYPTVYLNGEKLPSQMDDTYAHKPFEWRKHSAFYAELPASSMTRFDCRFEQRDRAELCVREQPADTLVLDRNPRMQVEINARTGLMSRLCVDGVEYLKDEAFCPLVMEDNYDAYGWEAPRFDKVLGRFEAMTPEQVRRCTGFEDTVTGPVRVVDDGEVRTVVQAMFRYGESQLCLRYAIPHHGTRIEVEAVVYWNEKGRMLKLSIPTALREGRYLGQQIFGTEEQTQNHSEVCGQKWSGLFDWEKDQALTWGCDGGYGSDCSEGEIRISMMRSPLFLSGEFNPACGFDHNRFEQRSDLGEHSIRFWVQAGPAQERRTHVDREALAWNEAPYILVLNPSGCGEKPAPMLTVDAPNVLVTAIKKAEDGSGDFIAHLFETTGCSTQAKLCSPLFDSKALLSFAPYELKTLRISPETRRWSESARIEI